VTVEFGAQVEAPSSDSSVSSSWLIVHRDLKPEDV